MVTDDELRERFSHIDARIKEVIEGNGRPGLRTVQDDLYGDPRTGRVGLVSLMRQGAEAQHRTDERTAALDTRTKTHALLLRLVLAAVVLQLASQIPVLADLLRLGLH